MEAWMIDDISVVLLYIVQQCHDYSHALMQRQDEIGVIHDIRKRMKYLKIIYSDNIWLLFIEVSKVSVYIWYIHVVV